MLVVSWRGVGGWRVHRVMIRDLRVCWGVIEGWRVCWGIIGGLRVRWRIMESSWVSESRLGGKWVVVVQIWPHQGINVDWGIASRVWVAIILLILMLKGWPR